MKKLGIEFIHLIAEAAGDDIISITQQVADGTAELLLLDDVAVVTRVENYPEGREVVIVCAQGKGLARQTQRLIDAAARIGAKSIRFHTSDPRMGSAARRWGYTEVQRIYRRVINGQQIKSEPTK